MTPSEEPKKIDLEIKLKIKNSDTVKVPKVRNVKLIKRLIALIVGLLIIIPIVIFLLSMYVFNIRAATIDSVTKVIPLPVAMVNGHWLNYAEWREGVATVNHFYSQKDQLGLSGSLPDLTPAQIESNELARLIEKELLNELATTYNVSVSQDEINAEYQDTILPQASSEEEIAKTIDTMYGWTVDQFKQQVVSEVVLRRKLQTAMNADTTINAAAKTKIDSAKAELVGGAAFADVAKKYSDDGSAQSGGDLGFISKGQTVPEFEGVAFATAQGAVSDIFSSVYGYHILTVLETGSEKDKVKVAHILAKFVSIDEELVTLKSAAKIQKLVKVDDVEAQVDATGQ